ncbi:hypothetical protein [Marinobacter subterrani]|uniref:hypothetical protein n=1 Tax=Marinobacter subterrani TaxID=1658765 RepID=UPI0023549F40|nr:hypothetical protein [Marinobacter subterrani]
MSRSQDIQEKGELHQQILENLYVYLEVMDKVGKRIGIERRQEIPAAIARAEEHLERSYAGDHLSYVDYQDISELARDIGHGVWNHKGETIAEKIAVVGVNENQMGLRIEKGDQGSLQELPQPLWQRMLRERNRLLDIPTDGMTPYEKLKYEMSLVSVNAGLEAHDRLADVALAAEVRSNQGENKKLPELNVQFISEPALRVWANATSKMGALPTDPSILMDALKQVEKGGRADSDMREEVADQWSKNQPRLSREWIRHATNSIMGSATSTSLDSLDMSSAAFVRSVFQDAYQKQGGQGIKVDDGVIQQSREELSQSLNSIEQALSELNKVPGNNFPPSLVDKITREAETLRELVRMADLDEDDAEDLHVPTLG